MGDVAGPSADPRGGITGADASELGLRAEDVFVVTASPEVLEPEGLRRSLFEVKAPSGSTSAQLVWSGTCRKVGGAEDTVWVVSTDLELTLEVVVPPQRPCTVTLDVSARGRPASGDGATIDAG